jgi:hypothetical protein
MLFFAVLAGMAGSALFAVDGVWQHRNKGVGPRNGGLRARYIWGRAMADVDVPHLAWDYVHAAYFHILCHAHMLFIVIRRSISTIWWNEWAGNQVGDVTNSPLGATSHHQHLLASHHQRLLAPHRMRLWAPASGEERANP